MTSPVFPCRFDQHGPAEGVWNMAVDAQMLDRAVAGQATFRTYQWSCPTISLGHFQARTAAEIPARFASLPSVIRLSGGGAILHDQELTYSLALPKSHPLTATPSQLYNTVHDCLIEVLREWGVDCRMRGDAAFAAKPFLCFGRGDERDIVMGENKVVGSAQRRRQGAVLQHGSLLLRQSPLAPEFPGILELTNKQIAAEELSQMLCQAVREPLHLVEVSSS